MRMLRVHIEYKSIQNTNGRIDLQYPKQFGNKHVCSSAAAAAAAATIVVRRMDAHRQVEFGTL